MPGDDSKVSNCRRPELLHMNIAPLKAKANDQKRETVCFLKRTIQYLLELLLIVMTRNTNLELCSTTLLQITTVFSKEVIVILSFL